MIQEILLVIRSIFQSDLQLAQHTALTVQEKVYQEVAVAAVQSVFYSHYLYVGAAQVLNYLADLAQLTRTLGSKQIANGERDELHVLQLEVVTAFVHVV